MHIQPTRDLLLIRRIEDPKPITNWGFELMPTEENAETPYRGIVLFAGAGKYSAMAPASETALNELSDLLDHYKTSIHAVDHFRASKALKEARAAYSRIPMSVKVGDTVIFSKNLLQEFRIGNEVLCAMGEASILAVLDD
jgi:co-chaperonin GroES (HSP10)